MARSGRLPPHCVRLRLTENVSSIRAYEEESCCRDSWQCCERWPPGPVNIRVRDLKEDRMTRQIRVGFLVAAAFLLVGNAQAQSASSGAIAGEVRDTTGAVLPGVTIEAASPALIEKVRTVVTDSQGQYKIVELRPGAYTVTFSLSGFSTLRRENIQLTAGFTATVNGDMRLGALEETVTVSGASPLVDTQNVRSQNVLSREVLDALPSSRTFNSYAALTVGANAAVAGGGQDVGGTIGDS